MIIMNGNFIMILIGIIIKMFIIEEDILEKNIIFLKNYLIIFCY
jgi:hypothetical protein